jgi:hypothetical protein
MDTIIQFFFEYALESGIIAAATVGAAVRHRLKEQLIFQLPWQTRKQTLEINTTLAMLCGKAGADRGHFYRYHKNKNEFSCTHEVLRAGITGYMDRRLKFKNEIYDNVLHIMRRDGYVFFKEPKDCGTQPLKATLISKGTRSIIMYPIIDASGDEVGFMDIEYVRAPLSREKDKVIRYVTQTANTLGGIISR